MMKSSYKYLAKNIGVLTISNFATKLLSFFLVPLYTSILTTYEYGVFDFISTTVLLIIPVLTENIQDASVRFSMDVNNDKQGVFTVSLRYFFQGLICLSILVMINYLFSFNGLFKEYGFIMIIMYIFQAMTGILISFAKGNEMIGAISTSSLLGSVIIIASNILFLCFVKIGIVGYFIANIMGYVAQTIFLSVSIKTWRYYRPLNRYNALRKDMVKYSRPMVLNATAWWVNNASDRYIVTWLCGTAANGIYSVAYKIPSILNIMQNIFDMAWSLSAYKEFDGDDNDGFFSKMYAGYNLLIVIVCSAFIVLDKFFCKILFANEFYLAWKYVPFLMISVVFSALGGYIGGIFTALKISKEFAISTTVGAVVNFILNIILIIKVGVIGAAIATAISYFVVWLLRLVYLKKYLRMNISMIKNSISYIILCIQACAILLIKDDISMYCCEIVLFMIVVLIYIKQIMQICKKFKNVLIKR